MAGFGHERLLVTDIAITVASTFPTLPTLKCSRIVPIREARFETGKRESHLMISGSCCCGAIKFELLAEPSMMGTCHCTRCRKVGASTFVFVKKEDLKWIQGRDHVQLFEPVSPYKYGRCFCRICGTSLGEILSEADSFPIAVNVLDSELSLRPRFHEFVAEKPSWYEICDDAKQFDRHPAPS